MTSSALVFDIQVILLELINCIGIRMLAFWAFEKLSPVRLGGNLNILSAVKSGAFSLLAGSVEQCRMLLELLSTPSTPNIVIFRLDVEGLRIHSSDKPNKSSNTSLSLDVSRSSRCCAYLAASTRPGSVSAYRFPLRTNQPSLQSRVWELQASYHCPGRLTVPCFFTKVQRTKVYTTTCGL